MAHPVIQNFSYEIFQQKMLRFLESHLDDTEPYLLTVCLGLSSVPIAMFGSWSMGGSGNLEVKRVAACLCSAYDDLLPMAGGT